MRIRNRTRKTLLGSNVRLAASWWERLRGYLGRPAPKPGEGMLLVGCNGIHTYWMTFDLDVLFLDEKGTVLESVRSLRPWRKTRRVRGARYVLEVPAGTIDSSKTQVGDELSWRDPAPYSISVLSGNKTGDQQSSILSRRRIG